MATAAIDSHSIVSFAEPTLTNAVLGAVENALVMCGTSARFVGLSAVPSREGGLLTGLIGIQGKVSGFITVNMSQRMAIKTVEGLLQDSYGELTSQVVDGAGEITNIIVGGIKSALAGTPWSFSHITVPSVIIGERYQIAYARGLDVLCATFEHDDPEAVMLEDRLMRISLSMLRL